MIEQDKPKPAEPSVEDILFEGEEDDGDHGGTTELTGDDTAETSPQGDGDGIRNDGE